VDLDGLYAASFIDWEAVAASWSKRTVSSRLLLFAARRYLETEPGRQKAERAEVVEPASLPEEIKATFAAPPDPESPASRSWGEFVDAALAAELEMVPYGERPVLLGELRAGLAQAAEEADPRTPLGRWFLTRRDALPGEDLPDNPEYLPV
jgi:DNA-binding transcriptional MocR family regulator